MKTNISHPPCTITGCATKLRLFFPCALALGAMGLLLFILAGTVSAHEAAPEAPPLLPACHVSAKQCVSSTYLHETPFPARLLPTSLATTTVTTETLVADTWTPDGKWLQPIDGLALGNHRSSTPDLLSNVPCTAGFADVFACNNMDLLAYLPTEEIGGQFNNDLWGWVDPANGTEYALVGARDGVIFLDLSVPTAPRYLGKLPSHGNTSSWRDIKVYRDHAFIVADFNRNHGLQIFDLTQLRNVENPPVVFQETAHYAGFSNAHNIAINEESGFAYAVGTETCQGGLHIIDINTITTPVQAGCYPRDGYIHDTQCVIYRGPDARYQGRELCFNASVSQMTIVDVTEKALPQRIGTLHYTGSAYIHQGWLTPDQRYFVLNDEMDETRSNHNTRTYLIDLNRVDAPRLIGSYTAPFTAIDHNLYISDTYIYEANYTSGLRVLDGKDMAQGRLQEVAGFDTFPDHDEPVYAGAWTAYPYFPSGIVVVSTIDRGAFILQPHLPADVIVTDRTNDVALCQPNLPSGLYTTTVTLRARNGYTQSAALRITADTAPTPAAVAPPTVSFQQQTTATETVSLDLGSAALGTHFFTTTVTAPTAAKLDEAVWQLHLAETVATTPTLLAPSSQLTQTGPITFTWQPVAAAHSYRLEVATDAAFTEVVFRDELKASTYLLRQPLAYNRQYYWRVIPLNGCGEGAAAGGELHTAMATFLPIIRR
ncbi:MAG: choice-of-anchor B family protein [Caldilineaceae bacterium]|nr:choice-of-anchor B family protein [Caldilineaceae bacterium]